MSEYLHVEKPFLDQLAALGWEVVDQGTGTISVDPATSLRTSFRECLLPHVFRDAVRDLNRMPDGRPWLTDAQLDDLLDQVQRQPNRSLLEANEAIQSLLFKAQVDRNELTGEADPVATLIDFAHPERNRFTAINQFRVDTPGGVKQFIVPDIVLFANGLPLAVVECKLAGPTCANPLREAFMQLQRYRNGRTETAAAGLREGEPRLFHCNLLLIRSTGAAADYGTISSGEEHFHAWKNDGGDGGQAALIRGMLDKEAFLAILRCCTVFMDTESGQRVKVVCRYQQFRAARRIVERLRTRGTPAERSGVVWHTQGSGKSLTMVFLARMLRASTDLCDYKLVLVNDRVDLEDQLAATAKLIGGKVNVIESTAQLRSLLAAPASDINMAMVHKFREHRESLPLHVAEALTSYGAPPSAETFGVVNDSERILILVDEAHRTQGSDLGDNLFEAFPNATRIAFTGTPLRTERHGERRTHRRFGEYIDTYKLLDAAADGATLRILYEGKTADTALDDRHGFDARFEDLFRNRSDAELLAIKKKYGATGDILEAEQRIEAIARDLVDHYVEHILPNGFKAQVVCHSKRAAVRYQRFIREALAGRIAREKGREAPDAELIAQLEFLKVAVVISSGGTNEPAYVTHARREAQAWQAVKNFCRPFDRCDPDKVYSGIAFLVVCDMLLTGFDAPVEQVMYIDKKLTEHNLLQAIARVNRVAKGKRRGYVVDYIGLASHLTAALSLYAAAGEETELAEGLKSITSELPVLEERYRRLLRHFAQLGITEVGAFVEGRMADSQADLRLTHAAVGKLKDIRARADFEVFFKKFLSSLDIVLPHAAGQPYRVPAKRFGYLLAVAKERYKDESLQLGDAGEKVKRLINEHLISLGINPKVPPVELLAPDFVERLQAHACGNPEAKASEMEHAIRRHCTVHFDEDPAFYRRLSDKLEQLIRQHRDNWEALAEDLEGLRAEAAAGRRQALPGLDREATVFFEHVAELGFGAKGVPPEYEPRLKATTSRLVDVLRENVGMVAFWSNIAEQRRLRGELANLLLLADVPQLTENYERLAVELVKLAKTRQAELLGERKA